MKKEKYESLLKNNKTLAGEQEETYIDLFSKDSKQEVPMPATMVPKAV